MAVSGVNGAQSPEFVELVNKPQVAYVNNTPQMSMNGQPMYDVYEGPRQEKKKSSVLGKIFKTLILAAALVGLNRYAHHKEWIKPVAEDAEGFANKFIKKPLNSVDDYVLKTYNKCFKKGVPEVAPN